MPISEFCTRDVICAGREATALEAARLMRHHHVGDIVVVDDTDGVRKPTGIVTDRDLTLEVMAAGLDPGTVKVGELLLRPMVTVEHTAGYAETVRLMAVNGVRRMPVVGPGGALLGIITLDDMLRQLTSPLAALTDLAGRAQGFERKTRV